MRSAPLTAAAAPSDTADGGAVAPSATALARAGALNLVARLASGAAILGLAALSTNVLDTQGRGIYAILSTVAGIAMTVITGGTAVLAADLIHGRHRVATLHGATAAIAIGSALVLVPLAAGVSLLTSSATLAVLLLTAAVAVLVTYSNFEMYLAQARGDVLRVSLTDLGMALSPLVATAVAVAVVQPTVTTLMAAWAIGALVTATLQLAVALTTGVVIRNAWRVAADIMRRSVGIAFLNGISLLGARIDVLVVAVVLSTSTAGVYSIPVALAAAVLLLSRSLLTAVYHSLMTAPEGDVAARLSAALRHSVIIVLAGGCLSIPLVAVAAGFVFGDAYSEIWRPYAILVPASACICTVEVLRHFLLTRLERQREFVLTAVAVLFLNFGLAVVGAAEFGLLGAAASTTISYAALASVLVAFCARWLSVPMRELAVPRRSDLAVYPRVLRDVVASRWAARS